MGFYAGYYVIVGGVVLFAVLVTLLDGIEYRRELRRRRIRDLSL